MFCPRMQLTEGRIKLPIEGEETKKSCSPDAASPETAYSQMSDAPTDWMQPEFFLRFNFFEQHFCRWIISDRRLLLLFNHWQETIKENLENLLDLLSWDPRQVDSCFELFLRVGLRLRVKVVFNVEPLLKHTIYSFEYKDERNYGELNSQIVVHRVCGQDSCQCRTCAARRPRSAGSLPPRTAQRRRHPSRTGRGWRWQDQAS